MTAQAVEPGRILAGRYRVEDMLDEVGNVRSWRAMDEVLSRAVYVQTVPSDDENADAVTRAARAASHVADTRFLQVLDVDEVDGVAYFVREWLPGQNLAAMVAAGPLEPAQAAMLGHEVAEAIAAAHLQDIAHLRLEPSSVIIAPNGSVKIAGLGTEAALHDVSEDDPAQADAAGVGRILYASLTGRWPGEGSRGLPEALRIEGRFASPRQVRPGVPRLLDEVVDRALGNADRHHAAPLGTPGDIADALSDGSAGIWGNGVLGDSNEGQWPPPAVLDEPITPLTSNRAIPLAQQRPDDRGSSQRTIVRAVGVLIASLFLIGAAVLGWRMLLGAVGTDDQASGNAPDPAVSDDASQPADEDDEDPASNDDEDPEDEDPADDDVAVTLSADPATVAPGSRINLTGTIEPAADGVVLRVERRFDGGSWENFPDDSDPVSATTQGDGAFSTWVNTSRQGENEWRLVGTVDGEEIESNTVSVTVS